MALEHTRLASALALARLSLPPAGAAPGGIQGRALVVDGDTLEVAGTRVRLAGIDAPELDQLCSTGGDVRAAGSTTYRCGEEAAAALAGRIAGDPVICEPQAAADPTVLVAVCELNGEDLGAWMVRDGWARAYPASGSAYAAMEKPAQSALVGIWRGDFLNPWDWRREQRAATGDAQRRLRVAVGAANVRAEPSRQGRLLATLPRDTIVEQLRQSDAWYLVRVPQGPSGWIFGELLERLQPAENMDQ
jgi:endonuclease YncB( thermonuclease family)